MQQMITHTHSTRLLFRKYQYMVRCHIAVPTITRQGYLYARERERALDQTKKWLSSNCAGGFRTMASWKKSRMVYDESVLFSHKCLFTVYFGKRSDYEHFIGHGGHGITETMCPANEAHEAMIAKGMHIEIRERLYYNRFRYRVSFGKPWGTGRKSLLEHIRYQLHDSAKRKQDYKVSNADCTLYLWQESDLTLIRFSLGDAVTKVTVAAVPSELSQG